MMIIMRSKRRMMMMMRLLLLIIYLGSSDATIKVWDVIKGYCTHNLKGSSGVVAYVFVCVCDGVMVCVTLYVLG